MQYRRSRAEGGSYFFTVVTNRRRPFLCDPDNIILLRSIFREVKERHPFTINAVVILPDHLHCLWTLPEEDADYSTRWRLIKSAFSRQCKAQYRGVTAKSRHHKQEQAVWQRRFWEHKIRSDLDYRQHVEYIHYNPVKHGLTTTPADWPFSSFLRSVAEGRYERNWGAGVKMKFGETIGGE
ncbi:transposase IS200 like protein [bacterium BMS3Bbin14]|nr:transposase IS200 like protein [bacterium BMS3Bbin14]